MTLHVKIFDELLLINLSSLLLLLLCLGSGVEPDAKKSAEIFTDLALKGHPFAQVYSIHAVVILYICVLHSTYYKLLQFTLAGMYLTGIGVEKNYVRAYTLYKVSFLEYFIAFVNKGILTN